MARLGMPASANGSFKDRYLEAMRPALLNINAVGVMHELRPNLAWLFVRSDIRVVRSPLGRVRIEKANVLGNVIHCS